jgi:hypothetical protein
MATKGWTSLINQFEFLMHWRSRARQIVYLVNFHIQRESDIVAHQFKIRVANQMGNICFTAGKEIIHTQNIIAILKELIKYFQLSVLR